jgi:hypothetical protein
VHKKLHTDTQVLMLVNSGQVRDLWMCVGLFEAEGQILALERHRGWIFEVRGANRGLAGMRNKVYRHCRSVWAVHRDTKLDHSSDILCVSES